MSRNLVTLPAVVSPLPRQLYVTRKELADLFSVSERTLKRWTADGLLPVVKAPGNVRLYNLAECVAILESWTHRGRTGRSK